MADHEPGRSFSPQEWNEHLRDKVQEAFDNMTDEEKKMREDALAKMNRSAD